MTAEFDPYHRWLGIPPKHQPANLYRLLGMEPYESDPEVIRDASERQIAHVRSYALGQHREVSQQLLNELATAKAVLLDPVRKQQYDAELSRKLGSSLVAKAPTRSWVVGSSEECDIVVDEPPVSGIHCRVTKTQNGYLIEDLHSTNGTFADGHKVESPLVVPFQHPITLGKRTPFPWKELLLTKAKPLEPAKKPEEASPRDPEPAAAALEPVESSKSNLVFSFQFWVAILIAAAIFSVVLLVFLAIAD